MRSNSISLASTSLTALELSLSTNIAITDAPQYYIWPDPNKCMIPEDQPQMRWDKKPTKTHSHAFTREDGVLWEMNLMFCKLEIGTNKYLGG